MTIKNTLSLIVLSAVSPISPSLGLDVISDFGDVTVEPLAFSSDFTAAPVGEAFRSDFEVGSYSVAGGIEVYGRNQVRIDSAAGAHSRGTTLIVMRDGFESDFARWVDPQMPAEYDNVSVVSDFAKGRHVAETYPPPSAFDSDFSAAGLSFASQFTEDAYRKATGDTVYGRYRYSADDVGLSGRPITGSRPFVIEQMLPGTAVDDRLGYFRLGETTLGGPAV